MDDCNYRLQIRTDGLGETTRQAARWLVALTLVVGLLTMPVAAQDEGGDGEGSNTIDVCSDNSEFLPDLANGIIQLCILGGAIGGFVSYLGTTAMESMPSASEEQQERMRKIRAKSVSAAVKVFAAGPLFLLLINFAGLPWADCIQPVPF